MKSILRTAAAGVALASFSVASAASAATTASATADAEILAALSIAVDATADTLDFGTVAIGNIGAPASLVVAPDGTLTGCSAQVICGGTPAAPTFHIDGLAADVVDITLPATVTLSSGANSMLVGTFVTSLPGTQVTLNGTGDASFSLGGTLTVATNQAPGVYTGSVNVSVAYN